MKIKALSIIVVLSMLSALVLVPLPASAAEPIDFTYEVVDGKATITGYTGSDAEVTVPGEIGEYTVTEIGEHAFFGNNAIEKVILPDSIETIADQAFASCNRLHTVTVPKNLTKIGAYVFMETILRDFKMPDRVSFIGEGAFFGTKLTYINLPALLTSLNSAVFELCSELAYIRIPASVTSIDAQCFYLCDSNLLTIVGYTGSAAQAYAEEHGFAFASLVCKNHVFSSGVCSFCGALLGDLNKDGAVNADDYTILVGYVNDPATCPDVSIADVNQDGILDIYDRLFLLEIITGVSTWPV